MANITNTITKNLARNSKRPLAKIEMVGLSLFAASMLTLLVAPEIISGAFDQMVTRAHPVVIKTGIISTMSVSIMLSVIMGRFLERMGFTDALIRIFLPIAKVIKINAAILIPSIYNILGDINAAGRISGPILMKTGATKDEKKIAIATMMQFQASFSVFMLGLTCLTLANVNVFMVIVLSQFIPVFLVPFILRNTIWRNCKYVELEEVPVFTPNTPIMTTLFAAAREGAELLFLFILPAFCLMFGIIGLLEYAGIWQYVDNFLISMLTVLNIDPVTGSQTILVSNTLAMTNLRETAAALNPALVIGSFVLGCSGFPLSVVFAQAPMIWSTTTDLTIKETIQATVLGGVIRILYAGLIAVFLVPILI